MKHGQSLDAKKTADDIIWEILRVAQFLQSECRASIKCIFLLPIMPRYIQGQVDKREQICNYNAVAEQVNSGLRNVLENDDVIKFFHAGKKFNFSGESYIYRAEQFDDDGIHLKMGQSPDGALSLITTARRSKRPERHAYYFCLILYHTIIPHFVSIHEVLSYKNNFLILCLLLYHEVLPSILISFIYLSMQLSNCILYYFRRYCWWYIYLLF